MLLEPLWCLSPFIWNLHNSTFLVADGLRDYLEAAHIGLQCYGLYRYLSSATPKCVRVFFHAFFHIAVVRYRMRQRSSILKIIFRHVQFFVFISPRIPYIISSSSYWNRCSCLNPTKNKFIETIFGVVSFKDVFLSYVEACSNAHFTCFLLKIFYIFIVQKVLIRKPLFT